MPPKSRCSFKWRSRVCPPASLRSRQYWSAIIERKKKEEGLLLRIIFKLAAVVNSRGCWGRTHRVVIVRKRSFRSFFREAFSLSCTRRRDPTQTERRGWNPRGAYIGSSPTYLEPTTHGLRELRGVGFAEQKKKRIRVSRMLKNCVQNWVSPGGVIDTLFITSWSSEIFPW